MLPTTYWSFICEYISFLQMDETTCTLRDELLQIIILCFAVDGRSSFDNISAIWMPEIERHDRDLPIILLGTRSDTRHGHIPDEYFVSRNEGENLAKKIKAHCYIECSALNGENVYLLFQEAILTMMPENGVPNRRQSNKRPKKRKRRQQPCICCCCCIPRPRHR